jgi:dephospho-CoA kinase
MLRVGLTGGIASGKSLAAEVFKELGARLIDADSIAREIVEPGREGWKKIVENFGRDVLEKNGIVDREKLGSIVFSDTTKRKLLNNLLHPLIIGKIKKALKEIEKQESVPMVIVDVPLLIECGLQKYFDKILVVYADRLTQKKRLMERSHLKEKEAEARIDSQMKLDEKRERADYIIENSGSRPELKKQVLRVYGLLGRDLEEKGRN